MSGFWEVGEEGVGDMIWQVSNESYEAKLGEWKNYVQREGMKILMTFYLPTFRFLSWPSEFNTVKILHVCSGEILKRHWWILPITRRHYFYKWSLIQFNKKIKIK